MKQIFFIATAITAVSSPQSSLAESTDINLAANNGTSPLTFTATDTNNDNLDAVAMALQTGDASYLNSKEQALDLAIQTLKDGATSADNLVRNIYQDDTVAYNPGKNSNFIQTSDIDNSASLVVGNKANSLAVIGEDQARYTAFGSDIIRNFDGFQPSFTHLSNWLISKDPAITPTDPVIAVTQYSLTYAQNAFSSLYDNASFINCTTAVELASCAANADLLVIGSQGSDSDAEALANGVAALIDKGVSIFYSHTATWKDTQSAIAVLDKMNINLGPYGGNFWENDIAQWNNVDDMLAENSLIATLLKPLENIRDDTLTFDWSQCTTYVSLVSCNSVDQLDNEFINGTQLLKNHLNQLDEQNKSLFDQTGNKAWKLMTLYADKVRENIVYPMDKNETDGAEFFAALYADYGVHYHRQHNAAQSDLGTFDDVTSSLQAPLIDKSTSVTISKNGGFTAIGLYAKPGVTFQVSRDNQLSDEPMWIKINTQVIGSSRYWNKLTYDRPAFLQSSEFPIAAGETLELSSPYGGTLQLVTKERDTDTAITLTLKQVAQHAVLTDLSEGSAYFDELSNGPIGWTEITTPYVQIHSLGSKMQNAFNASPYNGDFSRYFDDLDTYMIKNTYNLAGFTGTDLSLSASVNNFCETHDWICIDENIHTRPAVQHINVDEYAHCGSACSGNPFDQKYDLDPLGWGSSHEIGHNLQSDRLKIEAGRSNEVSNQIFPIHKDVSWYQDTGESIEATRSNYQSAFTLLVQAANEADPKAKAKQLIWDSTGTYDNNGERIGFYMQLVHLNEATDWGSPWDVYTLSYLLERQFTAYIETDSLWQANKEALGFGLYDTAPKDITGNDFMLIAHSFISGQDLRPIFDLWGIYYSQEASVQVEAYGYPQAEKVFYYSDDTNKPSKGSISITPDSEWPL